MPVTIVKRRVASRRPRAMPNLRGDTGRGRWGWLLWFASGERILQSAELHRLLEEATTMSDTPDPVEPDDIPPVEDPPDE